MTYEIKWDFSVHFFTFTRILIFFVPVQTKSSTADKEHSYGGAYTGLKPVFPTRNLC